MTERFQIVDVNPNDTVGGGGCLCSESKVADCKGPYAVFPVTDMENGLSPHVVIGSQCICAAQRALEGDTLKGGEINDQIGTDPEKPINFDGFSTTSALEQLSIEDKADEELELVEAELVPEV